MIKSISVKAAEEPEIQCLYQYCNENPNWRGTAVHKLSKKEQSNLPTDSMDKKCYLAKFRQLAAKSAQHYNKFFNSRYIRDDLIFDKKESISSPKTTKNLTTINYLMIGRLVGQNYKKKCKSRGSKKLCWKENIPVNLLTSSWDDANFMEVQLQQQKK